MVTLAQLKRQRDKLLILAKKEREAKAKRIKLMQEELALKQEISKLKAETSMGAIARAKRLIKDPKTQKKAKVVMSFLKKLNKEAKARGW